MKLYEKIKTGVDWAFFSSQVDLVHNDKPLYIPNFLPSPNKYVTWNDIENYINLSQGHFSIIDNESKNLIPSPFISSFNNREIQDKNHTHQNINNGSSFILAEHDLHHLYTSALSSEIDDIFKVASEAQVIGSKNSNSISFPPHLDSDPVFIFQIQGEIEWTLYDNKVTNLGNRDLINKYLDYNKLTNPKTYPLSPGDFLYVPQRTYHNIKVKSQRLTLTFPCHNIEYTSPIDRNYYQL
jgi:ribosomal protein L16 Arg81 hydroxylase